MKSMTLARSTVSYLPESSVLWLRHLSTRLRPNHLHEPELGLVGALGRTPRVVDIGGNRGQTILSVRSTAPEAEIWTFEPNPRLAHWLARRFVDERTRIHPFGLGSEDLDTTLFVPRYGHVGFDTRASLDEETAWSFLSEEFFAPYRSARASVDSVSIRIRRLDDQGLSPDVVKIDVEGAEDAVVDGGWTTISEHRPLLIVEGATDHLVARLATLDYAPCRWDEGRLVPGTGTPRNTVFVGPAHESALGDLLGP
jgi:FkbM family methyltransferase